MEKEPMGTEVKAVKIRKDGQPYRKNGAPIGKNQKFETERDRVTWLLSEHRKRSANDSGKWKDNEWKQWGAKESQLLTWLMNLPANPWTEGKYLDANGYAHPIPDKSLLPDKTIELHKLADAGRWDELRTLYPTCKCNHFAFYGPTRGSSSILVVKAVQSGDLNLVIAMVADGANVDIPAVDPVSPQSARQLIALRGRQDMDFGMSETLKFAQGENETLRPRKAGWSNSGLWDYFIGPFKWR